VVACVLKDHTAFTLSVNLLFELKKMKVILPFETSPCNIASHARRLETSGLNLILDYFIINDNDRPSVTYFILKYAPIQTSPF
jgi:hypothetical protein